MPLVLVQTDTSTGTFTTVAYSDPDNAWRIVVDRESGVVVETHAELPGDDFAIPGIGLDVISLTYEPGFAEGWFATTETAPPTIPRETIAYTSTETVLGRAAQDGTATRDSATLVARVTWQDNGIRRLDILSEVGLGSEGPGNYAICADQMLYHYFADSNTFREERFFAVEGRRNLVAFNCDATGACGPENFRRPAKPRPTASSSRGASRATTVSGLIPMEPSPVGSTTSSATCSSWTLDWPASRSSRSI